MIAVRNRANIVDFRCDFGYQLQGELLRPADSAGQNLACPIRGPTQQRYQNHHRISGQVSELSVFDGVVFFDPVREVGDEGSG
jgi:hypothetical protein